MHPRVSHDRKYWIFADLGIVSHDLAIIKFPPFNHHRHIEVSPRVTPQSHDRAISSRASDLHLTRSTICIFARGADDDWVDFGPLDRCASCRRYCIQRPWCRHVACKRRFWWEHSPTRKKRRQEARLKGGVR